MTTEFKSMIWEEIGDAGN